MFGFGLFTGGLMLSEVAKYHGEGFESYFEDEVKAESPIEEYFMELSFASLARSSAT